MLIDEIGLNSSHRVLDPFCGAATTLVECKKRDITCTGIEANPACVFASQVKTNWDLSADRVLDCLDDAASLFQRELRRNVGYTDDFTFRYLEQSGMLSRGWISPKPLQKAIAI